MKLKILSLLSAAFTSKWAGVKHNTERWFEIDANNLAAKHFDRKYGSGAPGYIKNNPDFFDRDKFHSGGKTLYQNPRYDDETSQRPHPTYGSKLVFWDFIL